MATTLEPLSTAGDRRTVLPASSEEPRRFDVPVASGRPLGPSSLLALAAEVARTGSWRRPTVRSDAPRTYELLDLTADYEVWAIHWPTGGRLDLHDHGGSAGALYVVTGELEETRLVGRATMRRLSITTGDGVAFGPSCLHDVINRASAPATSIHTYSPPMPHMDFYAPDASGLVRRRRREYRSDPTWYP